MTKLQSHQAVLAIDAEIKSEMIVEFVVKLVHLQSLESSLPEIAHRDQDRFRHHPMEFIH